MKGLLKVTNNGFRVCTTLYNDIWSNDVALHPKSKIKVNGDFKFSEVEFNLIDIDGQFFAELINLTKTNNQTFDTIFKKCLLFEIKNK